MKDFSPPPAGPFPMQANLQRLKPNLGSTVVTAATLIIFVLQGPLRDMSWKDFGDWQAYVALAVVLAAVIGGAWLISELLLKKIYFNSYGIGITRAGSTPTWYSFDELKTGTIKSSYSRARRENGKGMTITLDFHTGKLRIRTGLYGKNEVAALLAIVKKRTERDTSDSADAANTAYRPGSQPRGGPFSASGIPDADEPDIQPKKRW